MEREKAMKKQAAERAAAEKAAEAKKNARKDAPWLHEGIVVKVSSFDTGTADMWGNIYLHNTCHLWRKMHLLR